VHHEYILLTQIFEDEHLV